mgnify:FL=1
MGHKLDLVGLSTPVSTVRKLINFWWGGVDSAPCKVVGSAPAGTHHVHLEDRPP